MVNDGFCGLKLPLVVMEGGFHSHGGSPMSGNPDMENIIQLGMYLDYYHGDY